MNECYKPAPLGAFVERRGVVLAKPFAITNAMGGALH